MDRTRITSVVASTAAIQGAARRTAPGLALASVSAVALLKYGPIGPLPPMLAALISGVVLGNLPGRRAAAARPGLQLAARHLLRLGIVLLGFRLVAGDLAALGAAPLAMVAAVMAVTFASTMWLGRRLRVGQDLAVLTATGFSVCGLSAVAAASAVTEADDSDTATAMALVTLYGSLAVVALPLASNLLGLDPTVFGAWVGAGVHDVGQVVAAASTAGEEALDTAVVVKLARVVLLAPIVAALGILCRRRWPVRSDDTQQAGSRPPLIPGFVVCFLVAVTMRSLGVLPDAAVAAADAGQMWALAAALVGLGAGLRPETLKQVSLRPVLLGLASWVVVVAASLAGGLAVA